MNESRRSDFIWQGRVDREDSQMSQRLHQRVKQTSKLVELNQVPVLIGFACDEGVRRNQGKPGASEGPNAIRKALANLSCPADYLFYDVGDHVCVDEDMEGIQQHTANTITQILEKNGKPIVLGGGHEMGWASFLGAQQFMQAHAPEKKMGILNFDAHFDLRNPKPVTSSGTPFRQCQEWCHLNNVPFNYFVMGINPSVNTDALFSFAKNTGVRWVEDVDCHLANLTALEIRLVDWLEDIDYIYLTHCLDVFPAAYAPGVSAPSAVGVEPATVLQLTQFLQAEVKRQGKTILIADVAEMNPSLDVDERTAKLAARIVHQILV